MTLHRSTHYRAFGTFALILLVTACSSIPKVGSPGNAFVPAISSPNQINWPERYRLEDATFKVQNQIDIAAPAEVVWADLVHAERWPDWYVGAQNVRIDPHAWPSMANPQAELGAGSRFTWETMGLSFVSTITEFKPPHRLSWESRKSSIQGYHAWLIIPTNTGVRVITAESQHGFLARLQGIFQPNKLRKLHDVWLAELKKRAEEKVSVPE